jgi:hypothetical protein
MLLNRNALFVKGIRPHNYCLPILKREKHSKCRQLHGVKVVREPAQGRSCASSCPGLHLLDCKTAGYVNAADNDAARRRGSCCSSHQRVTQVLPRDRQCATCQGCKGGNIDTMWSCTNSLTSSRLRGKLHTILAAIIAVANLDHISLSLQESSCGCAGMFTAPIALGLYATAFEQAGALHHLEGFASHHGPDFYGMPRNKVR